MWWFMDILSNEQPKTFQGVNIGRVKLNVSLDWLHGMTALTFSNASTSIQRKERLVCTAMQAKVIKISTWPMRNIMQSSLINSKHTV